MNTLTTIGEFLLKQAAQVILGSSAFDRIEGVISRWEQKELSSLEKQQGAKAEIEMLGIEVAGRWANWAIETAVLLLKDKVQ